VVTAAADPAGAASMLQDSLAIHVRLGDRWRAASVVETIAELVAPADAELAAALLGGCTALRLALGAPVPPAERPAVDACLQAVRAALGAGPFARAWQRGEALTLDELRDTAGQAISTLGGHAAAAAEAAPDPLEEFRLTSRELAVLRLLSQGLTNREIGAALLISTGTAGVHVSNILRKLGVTSRVQAAALAQRARQEPARDEPIARPGP
jgi:DNA-binding CsgD family transcriptional regulator